MRGRVVLFLGVHAFTAVRVAGHHFWLAATRWQPDAKITVRNGLGSGVHLTVAGGRGHSASEHRRTSDRWPHGCHRMSRCRTTAMRMAGRTVHMIAGAEAGVLGVEWDSYCVTLACHTASHH